MCMFELQPVMQPVISATPCHLLPLAEPSFLVPASPATSSCWKNNIRDPARTRQARTAAAAATAAAAMVVRVAAAAVAGTGAMRMRSSPPGPASGLESGTGGAAPSLMPCVGWWAPWLCGWRLALPKWRRTASWATAWSPSQLPGDSAPGFGSMARATVLTARVGPPPGRWLCQADGQ